MAWTKLLECSRAVVSSRQRGMDGGTNKRGPIMHRSRPGYVEFRSCWTVMVATRRRKSVHHLIMHYNYYHTKARLAIAI